MAFSDLLKDAQNAQKFKVAATVKPAASSTSVMSLGLDESMTNSNLNSNSLMLNDTEEEWTLSSKYETTEKNTTGLKYSDDKFSTVDEKRNVKIDPNQINLTQESNSQYIPFLMPRYFDGIDLMNMELLIYYLNADGAEGWSSPINVCYNSTQIKFGWVLTELETALQGKLTFEIHAKSKYDHNGPLGRKYYFKTKPNSQLEVLESLHGNGQIIYDETWSKKFLDTVEDYRNDAEQASAEASAKLQEIMEIVQNAESDLTGYSKSEVNYRLDLKADKHVVEHLQEDVLDNTLNISKLREDITTELLKYYTKEEVDKLFEDFDISDQLTGIEERVGKVEEDIANFDGLAALRVEFNEETKTLSFYNGEETIADIVLNISSEEDIANALKPIEEDLQGIHEAIDDLPNTLATDYYKKTKVDELLNAKADKTTTDLLGQSLETLSNEVSGIDKSPRTKYKATYGDIELADGSKAEYMFTLWKEENGVETVQDRFQILGGGSGTGSSVSMKISYVEGYPQNSVFTVNDKIILKYNYEGIDSAGDYVGGTATWKIGNRVVLTEEISSGINEVNLTDFITVGNNAVHLTVTHSSGAVATKTWNVQKIDVKIESTFNDAFSNPLGDVSFAYTPYGAIEKTVHFILDGQEIGTVVTSASGIPTAYTLPSQPHGSHLLEVYMTAIVNNNTIESNHIFKDIIWYDETSKIPVIGCATPTVKVMQYNTVNIKYSVIDTNTETPKVKWYLGDEILSEETLTEKDDKGFYTYTYKANNYGTFVFTITCGEAEPKTITLNVEELDIDVSPVTAGLEFDFNPIGYSNNSKDRLWSYNDIKMTVSDNFDWVNGGYQVDENGDQYFCVKAGTNAIINYNLFVDDPKKTGKEFKAIFRTKNIRKRDTSFLTCMDNNIGLDMKVEDATIYNSGGSLKSNYCEDTIIEYEFNINKDTDMMIVMTYEDGTPSKPCEYTSTSSFKQSSPQPITIGSADCDVHIYRMKAYSISLTDTDIKNNFIADARNADEMIERYNRNQIYTDGSLIRTTTSGDFKVDALMKAAPDLRYIFLEVPRFTYDKDDKVDDCTVYFRYPNGTRPHDNWTCTGVRHRGQGTSSNSYGYAGRNIDLCMDRSNSLFKWTDEEGIERTSTTITLTDTSVPTDYLNIKVNIASSENANNAEMARRFNEFQPFLRYARKKDSRIKDTMEFYNCVLFIREASTDSSKYPHQEFNDTNWHFYAIGNVGDSKKTDDTRVNNAKDPKEHVVEITDADKPLCGFQTGKENNALCSVNEWTTGNTAYDILHSTDYVYDKEGKFKSFGGKTFEFRYEMDDITEEQREENINTWRDLYKFIVTSTDEEFYAHLKDYFVVDSALYYYLFTERYTMVDNRAKNSFWHYGKVYISNTEATILGEDEANCYIIDDEAASINDGYRYDLTFGYDFDTCLGIDNTGDYVFPYGKEDKDYYVDGDSTSDYVFRVADSVFFCRLRDLFQSEMQSMYKDREAKNTWSADSLIAQWDNSQVKFPEELWRLDYERKYYRTYLGLSIDNSIAKGKADTFLIGKFFGRKKYARRQFEANQEIYFATKYFGNKILTDEFYIRGNVPIGSSIKPNYSLTLVPYLDMYVCVKYTSTGTPIHKKVKAGQTCYFENDAERMDFIYIYAASYIQEVGDLSKCYVGDNDFSKAIRLQKLVIGSTDDGYENTFMENVLVKNNPLLEHLDLRNVSGINNVIDVSSCSNLKELYAEGTNATGVIFANGGLLETAHLPRIGSLSMKNLNYIKDFVVDGYDKLHTLIVENTSGVNTYDMVVNAPLLRIVRLINLNWDSTYQIQNGSIFNRLLTIGGIDSSNHETDISVLAGTAHVTVIGQQDLYNYENAWSDLTIVPKSITPQYKVTFRNYDGAVLLRPDGTPEIQYVNQYESAIDPTTRVDNPIIPVKESTIQYSYTFSGWDTSFTRVVEDTDIYATYKESLRDYTIRYVSMNDTQVYTATGKYGDHIVYDGMPTYTKEEPNAFYLFNRWDKSGFLTDGFDENGVKTVRAIFDKFEGNSTYFEGKNLKDLSPVQIYAMNKIGSDAINKVLGTDKKPYEIVVGNDIEYDDIESELLVNNKIYLPTSESTCFTGSNYIDTGIKLFDEDKDFILAIDYEFLSGNKQDAVLAECYQDGYNIGGFRLSYNISNEFTGVKFNWGDDSSNNVVDINKREIIVIRHQKGDNNIKIYKSNLDGDAVLVAELSRTRNTINNSTLIFGVSKPEEGYLENHAIGNINWAKIWYADLGDEVCKKLAMWTHETIRMESCGLRKYYLSDDPSKRCSFSLLASHLLGRKMKWNKTNTNDGGWAQCDLNRHLNARLYNAMPTQIKLLLKKVIVKSNDGLGSQTITVNGVNKTVYYTEVTSSDCYITIPSLIEVDPTKTTDPYNKEGTSISYLTNNSSRIRSFDGGDNFDYWLRSPGVGFSNYVWRVCDGNDDSNNLAGSTYEITGASSELGVLIEISF